MNEKKTVEELIEKAKRKAEKAYDPQEKHKREWLEAEPPHSYRSKGYKVKVFVLEGSPPKGYILADYCYGIVKAFGVRMHPLYTYTIENAPCI